MKWVDCAVFGVVAVAVDVIEDKRDFLKVCHANIPRDAGRNCVETITVRICSTICPRLTCSTSIPDHDQIAKIRSATPVVFPEFRWPLDIARNFGRWRDEVGAFVWICCHDAGNPVWGYGIHSVLSRDLFNPVLRVIDSYWSKSGPFIGVGSVNDWDVDEVSIGELEATPSLNEVTIYNWLELK